MKTLSGLAVALSVFLPAAVGAQTWSPEQAEVWKVVEDSWVAETAGNPDWYDEFVHPAFQGWSMSNPFPRSFQEGKRWNRFSRETSRNLIYSLHPMAIVVQGNTAMAFYYISGADEDLKGERKTTHSRQVETLIRVNGEWKFLGWLGGDEAGGGS